MFQTEFSVKQVNRLRRGLTAAEMKNVHGNFNLMSCWCRRLGNAVQRGPLSIGLPNLQMQQGMRLCLNVHVGVIGLRSTQHLVELSVGTSEHLSRQVKICWRIGRAFTQEHNDAAG